MSRPSTVAGNVNKFEPRKRVKRAKGGLRATAVTAQLGACDGAESAAFIAAVARLVGWVRQLGCFALWTWSLGVSGHDRRGAGCEWP